MNKNFLRKLSGIENLRGIFNGRFIIGLVFIIYGILIFCFNSIENFWVKVSITLAFFGLGLMFILEGQSILREYFRNEQKKKLGNKKITIINKKNNSKLKINLLGIYLIIILLIFILIGVLAYISKLENKFIFSLIIIACSGGIGGTLYSIRGFYQNLGEGNFNFNNWVWWYLFRPVMSAVIGVFVYFLIIGGLLSIGNISEFNYSKGLIFYSALAFLAGFSFTQFANKLEEIASTIFAKKEEEKKG